MDANIDKSEGNLNSQRRCLGIWYVTLDSILALSTVCGLFINCKNSRVQVFFNLISVQVLSLLLL